VSYHLSSDVKDLVKGISGVEALRTASELSLRLVVLTSHFPTVDQSYIDSLQKETQYRSGGVEGDAGL